MSTDCKLSFETDADVGWVQTWWISCSLWIGVAATAFLHERTTSQTQSNVCNIIISNLQDASVSCITVNTATCCSLENVVVFFFAWSDINHFLVWTLSSTPHLPMLRVDKIKHDENNDVMRIARYKKHKWFDSCYSSWVKQTFSRSHDVSFISSDVLQLKHNALEICNHIR